MFWCGHRCLSPLWAEREQRNSPWTTSRTVLFPQMSKTIACKISWLSKGQRQPALKGAKNNRHKAASTMTMSTVQLHSSRIQYDEILPQRGLLNCRQTVRTSQCLPLEFCRRYFGHLAYSHHQFSFSAAPLRRTRAPY